LAALIARGVAVIDSIRNFISFFGARTRRHGCCSAALLACCLLVPGQGAIAATFQTLYKFPADETGGINPCGPVIFGSSHDVLYGTAINGGPGSGHGAIFKLTKGADGKPWKSEILHTFHGGGSPYAGLVLWNGALFGSTQSDSTNYNGSVFKLGPVSKAFQTIYDFDTHVGLTGSPPQAGVYVLNGRLFGEGDTGGPRGGGTVWRLSPPAGTGTQWDVKVLHAFEDLDGFNVSPGFAIYQGVIYGNTFAGGANGVGAVYRIRKVDAATDKWAFNVLSSFKGGTDGAYPYGELLPDRGDLYGTTINGGTSDKGTVFKLSPNGDKWTRKTLLSLADFPGAPGYPNSGLVHDSAGFLYGTSRGGGRFDQGTIYRVARPTAARPSWRLTVLHEFGGSDGARPAAKLLLEQKNGHVILYGTTENGGHNENGTIFRLTL
jgi:uncharacterized repeat protein (TIGR03803 family)